MPHVPPDIIDGKAVKSLVDAQAIQGAVVLGQPGGWAVLVRYGAMERAISAQRARRPRLWRNLNTAAAFVREELGVPRFEVDTADYDPDAVERKRPDQAERLRRQREAAEHDAWFRSEVGKTLDGIAAGTVGLVSDEDHRKRWQKKRTEMLARAGQAG
ncbi:hypothetical protein [Mesorhizobium sp.]|uniref:hypothetical protein n=1 Tax=Mesorhizobium sp. TaxID=1871066 RepID=UPI000FE7751F|nr:hypothetical protein [Mesorhizobium sp.]RWI14082.1 MAG: hypothetical protein EOQ92_29940 [Mesorhizobium sp.]RWK46244.1 MAG: hypothetical protein EOR47_27110 [Mesorhizobium sp.]RWK92243.1 MAG: hypothetical protein EOR53_26995 [Mesorhizobium sp.]RWL01308.1 MAG: hypothetical protein EOR45_17825 [Mesorhizobium sp.]TIP60600.1 MAG: hypothetical protein E5X56_04855 [Mesorhizobium sp.]